MGTGPTSTSRGTTRRNTIIPSKKYWRSRSTTTEAATGTTAATPMASLIPTALKGLRYLTHERREYSLAGKRSLVAEMPQVSASAVQLAWMLFQVFTGSFLRSEVYKCFKFHKK